MTKKLSHVDQHGSAKMVDVSGKNVQLRTAIAVGKIKLHEDTIALVRQNDIVKGDVITVAKIAGIQAAKKTHDLIPLCHPLSLNKVGVEFQVRSNEIEVTSKVVCEGKTGVEMEALTAVNISLLTIYDMCKAVDKNMIISDISLLKKTKDDL